MSSKYRAQDYKIHNIEEQIKKVEIEILKEKQALLKEHKLVAADPSVLKSQNQELKDEVSQLKNILASCVSQSDLPFKSPTKTEQKQAKKPTNRQNNLKSQ